MNSLSCKSKLKTIKREKLLENNEICIVIPCSFNTNYDICRNPTITINLELDLEKKVEKLHL